jgi:hypothetical protein
MDKYPNDFNINTINKLRESKQKRLINNTRKNIYNTVMKNCNDGLDSTTFTFPTTLNRAYRIMLCSELLTHFKTITTEFQLNNDKPIVKEFRCYPDDEFICEYVSNHKDQSINIKSVRIDF